MNDGNQPTYDFNKDDDVMSIQREDVEINSNPSDRTVNEESN